MKIKNYLIAILAVLLLCSVVINLFQMREPVRASVVGTFLHGEQGLTGIYLVFTRDGGFMKYRQFEIIDVGEYPSIGDGIYTLQSNEGYPNTKKVLYREGRLYLFEQNGELTVFNRLSTMPSFINVIPPGEYSPQSG